MAQQRVLLVFDGTAWFLRQVALIEHDLALDEKVYHCDKPLGGPFKKLDKAIIKLKELTK